MPRHCESCHPPCRSSTNQGGENGHHAEQNDAGLAAAGRGGFEVEEVEYGEAFERAAARDRVVAGWIATGTARAFSDIERDAEAGAVQLVGKLGALERDNVGAEREGKSVRVPRGQAARSNR